MINGLALYAGYGGLDLGLGLVERDYQTVCHVEREASCAANLVARMEAQELCQAPIWDDSATFDGKPWRGVIDIITAGFPCPAVSIAGKRKGQQDERWLWPDVSRIVREVEPGSLLLENVRGLLSVNDGSAFTEVLWDLAEMGFDAVWGSVPSSGLGASQDRDRIFIVANSRGPRRERRELGRAFVKTARASRSIGKRRGDVGNLQDDNGRGQFQTEGAECRGGRSAGTGEALGDAAGDDQRRREPRRRQQPSGKSMSSMGITQGARGRQLPVQQGRQDETIPDFDWYGGGLGTHPPRPAEDRTWCEIIEQAPEAIPVVYGMADADSKRLDRLRMCGNGVDPVAAAYAWIVGQTVLSANSQRHDRSAI